MMPSFNRGKNPRYWAAFGVAGDGVSSELKRRCIRDFFRDAAFFLIIPFRAAVSNFLTISCNAAQALPVSFFRAKTSNFFTLVLTELFTALLRRRRSSLCR
jgi:hypothetical protein